MQVKFHDVLHEIRCEVAHDLEAPLLAAVADAVRPYCTGLGHRLPGWPFLLTNKIRIIIRKRRDSNIL